MTATAQKRLGRIPGDNQNRILPLALRIMIQETKPGTRTPIQRESNPLRTCPISPALELTIWCGSFD